MNRWITPTAVILATGMLGGCGGDLKTDMTMRLDGPIQMQMQMQGPTIKYEGTYVSDKVFEHVLVNKTDSQWLVAVLSEPDKKATLKGGDEIWKWEYRPTEQTVSAMTVFGGGTKNEPRLEPVIAYVRLHQGVVIEKWRD